VDGDVRDYKSVTDAMRDCNSVVHLAYKQRASRAGYAGSDEILDVAVRGTAAVLKACETRDVSDLLLVSSSEVYQGDLAPVPETAQLIIPDTLDMRYSYGCGKIASEMMAAAWGSGQRLKIARPFNVYGPDMGREHVIPEFCTRMKILAAQFPDAVIPFALAGTGQERRAFCYIDDCIDQLVLLLDKGEAYSIYNVGRMEERSIATVAQRVADCFGRLIKIIAAEPDGPPSRRVPDTQKIAGLGYTPQVSFGEGITRTVDWYKAHD
jgi:dTDP-glucose 4,6-dehydratase/UDP-glucose 4-epimerase